MNQEGKRAFFFTNMHVFASWTGWVHDICIRHMQLGLRVRVIQDQQHLCLPLSQFADLIKKRVVRRTNLHCIFNLSPEATTIMPALSTVKCRSKHI